MNHLQRISELRGELAEIRTALDRAKKRMDHNSRSLLSVQAARLNKALMEAEAERIVQERKVFMQRPASCS